VVGIFARKRDLPERLSHGAKERSMYRTPYNWEEGGSGNRPHLRNKESCDCRELERGGAMVLRLSGNGSQARGQPWAVV